jgi:hypothetical protein
MARYFLGAAVIMLIVFVIGILKPDPMVFWSKNKTQKQALWYLVICAIFGIIGVIIHLHLKF